MVKAWKVGLGLLIVSVVMVAVGYCLMKYAETEYPEASYDHFDEYYRPLVTKTPYLHIYAIGIWSVRISEFVLIPIGIIILIHEGLHLLRREPTPPIPKAKSTQSKQTYCGNCGKPIASDNKFCPSCGTPR